MQLAEGNISFSCVWSQHEVLYIIAGVLLVLDPAGTPFTRIWW